MQRHVINDVDQDHDFPVFPPMHHSAHYRLLIQSIDTLQKHSYDEPMPIWIKSSVLSAVFIWLDRCWFHGLTDVMTNRFGGWRQTLKRERREAALHESICASDSFAPGGPDNSWAACQHPGFGVKTVEKLCGRDKLPCITNIFNPLLDAAQPQDPHNQTGVEAECCRGPWDFKHPVLDNISYRFIHVVLTWFTDF